MSGNRRKPPQGRGRRAAQPQPPSGRRAAASRGAGPDSYGSRAEPRRAAQQGAGGGRRRAAAASGAVAGGRGGAGGPRGRGRAPQRKRFFDYPRSNKTGLRRWVPSWKQVVGVCFGFVALLVGLAGIALAMVQVPDPNAGATAQKNVYYWANGKQMVVAGGGDRNRVTVGLEQIPESMQWAVIAAENESFYEDKGVDPMGIVRSVGRMAVGGETQSGSTITQQYVKNTFLDQSQTLSRKAKELLISVKVGLQEDKQDILAGYLNTAYYGRGAYGIQAAAQAYYGIDSKDLSASQSAFLASTLNGPNLYDPAGGVGSNATKEKNHKRAEARWSWTLNRQVAIGKLSKQDRAKITKFPEPKQPTKSTELKGQTGYLVQLADNYITNNPESHITKRQLAQGGYRIHTTFSQKKTREMRKSVEAVKKANLNDKKRKVDKYVQFGGASVRPSDGAIVAIYGGDDATKHFTNNADDTGVQVGSTFKPFVMAAAMRNGKLDPKLPEPQSDDQRTKVSPKSIYNGNNKVKLRDYKGEVWTDKDGKEWHQKNDGGQSLGMIDLRTAMQESVNTPFIQLGMDVGTGKVREAALKAGLSKDSLARTTPTFSLGTSSPSAIRMASAYGTFAKSGVRAEPYSVSKVERKGELKFQNRKETENAFSPDVADNVTDMLKDVVQKGTGKPARALGRPAAGKTGTTDDNKSAWFTGYTPQLSTAVGMWRVNDRAKSQKFLKMYGVGGQDTIHGASFPAEIWTKYMTGALKNSKVMNFNKPSPIGETVYGDGASPTPTPTPEETPSDEPSDKPSETPTEKPTKTPDPSESCDDPDDPKCEDGGQNGGEESPTNGGGGDEGQIGGPGGVGGANGGDDGGGANGDPGGGADGGGDDGGFIAGPNSARSRDE